MGARAYIVIPVNEINPDAIPDEELDTVLSALTELSVKTPIDYVPHQKQLLFHLSEKKIRFLCGGNQSGKTEAGAAEDVMHATGLYPSWYPETGRFRSANKGRVIVTDYGSGGAVFEEKLWHWLPRSLVVSVRRTQKGELQKVFVKHRSGGTSMIEIMTHEQDDQAFESWTGHWAHFDEPPSHEKFTGTLRGLIALKGRSWLTLTPISEAWLFDEFIANENPDVFFIRVDIRDNPHLDERDIAFFASTLSEDVKDARLHGNFRHLSGLVYRGFDPAVHIVNRKDVKIDPSWPTYFVVDPHDQKPFFGIWAKVDPFNRIYVVDEIKFKGTIKTFCREVLLREISSGIKPMDVIRILDPNKGNTPSVVSGNTLKDDLALSGLYFTANVDDNITRGHLLVAGLLNYDPAAPISLANSPHIFWIRETTHECVRYMQLYTWDEYTGRTKDSRGEKEKPREKFKDFCDCIRYLAASKPMFFVADERDPQPLTGGGTTGYGPGE